MHVVHVGDTLTAIAAQARTTIAALASLNHIDPAKPIMIGQRLRVPAPAPRSPPQRATFASDARHVVGRLGVDPHLVRALAWMESGYQTEIVSSAGARGVLQTLPTTRDYVETVLAGQEIPHTVDGDIEVGILYLRHLLNVFRGNESLALAGWYQGERAVNEHGVYKVTKPFVANVLALASYVMRTLLRSSSSPAAARSRSRHPLAAGRSNLHPTVRHAAGASALHGHPRRMKERSRGKAGLDWHGPRTAARLPSSVSTVGRRPSTQRQRVLRRPTWNTAPIRASPRHRSRARIGKRGSSLAPVDRTQVRLSLRGARVGRRAGGLPGANQPRLARVPAGVEPEGASPSCSGGVLYDIGRDTPTFVVLAYGHTWHSHGFTCTSRVTGLTCTNGHGHGLFLSRESYRVW